MNDIFAAFGYHSEAVEHVFFLRVPPRIKYDLCRFRVRRHRIFSPGVYLVRAERRTDDFLGADLTSRKLEREIMEFLTIVEHMCDPMLTQLLVRHAHEELF